MKVRNAVHKGLRKFITEDDASGLGAQAVPKIRNILSFLFEMKDVAELEVLSQGRPHRLTGAQKGRWSLSVTRNWRLTFSVDEKNGEIFDLDYEDYH